MVENKSRGRGRPRKFDENEVLDKAVAVFWRKGFDATSVDDLAEAMGIGRPSMYGAFGDKEAIFMRCLERYSGTICYPPLCALERGATAREAILGYLEGVAEYISDPEHQGCMLGAVTCAREESKVRDFVVAQVAGAEAKVADRLQAAVESGELPSDFPVARRARRAINAMLALSTRARHNTPREMLLADAEDGTDSVLAR